MKGRSWGFIFLTIGILMMIGSIFIMVYDESNSYTKKGNCYDRYGSLINDLTCDVRVHSSDTPIQIAIVIFYSLIMFFCFIIGMGLILNHSSNSPYNQNKSVEDKNVD